MQFTRAEEYGIFGVMYLAKQDKDKIVSLSEIAHAEDVPEKFLAKIFQNLTKTGLVRSHRGLRGGFSLTKDPDKITMKDVVEAVQGPYHLIKCLQDKDCCGKYTNCPVRHVLEITEKGILEVFGSFTITDLLELKKKSVKTTK